MPAPKVWFFTPCFLRVYNRLRGRGHGAGKGRLTTARVNVACWAHGRRGFEEALPATSHPLVHEAMIWTRQLYDLEDRAKEMSAEDRQALRQAEAVPILARTTAASRFHCSVAAGNSGPSCNTFGPPV